MEIWLRPPSNLQICRNGNIWIESELYWNKSSSDPLKASEVREFRGSSKDLYSDSIVVDPSLIKDSLSVSVTEKEIRQWWVYALKATRHTLEEPTRRVYFFPFQFPGTKASSKIVQTVYSPNRWIPKISLSQKKNCYSRDCDSPFAFESISIVVITMKEIDTTRSAAPTRRKQRRPFV